MRSKLEQKLSKQIKLQTWSLVLTFIYIIGLILTIVGFTDSFKMIDGKWVSIRLSASPLIFIGMIIIFPIGIANLVLWILGIVNAVSINTITRDSTWLIVFSVFTFWIVAIIKAITEINKYKNKNYLIVNNNFMQNNANVDDEFTQKQQSLQNALANGVISPAEFEEKMKEIKKQHQK